MKGCNPGSCDRGWCWVTVSWSRPLTSERQLEKWRGLRLTARFEKWALLQKLRSSFCWMSQQWSNKFIRLCEYQIRRRPLWRRDFTELYFCDSMVNSAKLTKSMCVVFNESFWELSVCSSTLYIQISECQMLEEALGCVLHGSSEQLKNS